MKSVMISIQPKWCELIASGEKTVEVRKTRPKIEVPFKCYIYCTLPPKEELFTHGCFREYANELIRLQDGRIVYDYGMRLCCDIENRPYSQDNFLCKKVIGEFVCDKMLESFLNNNDGLFIEKGCLTQKEIDEYQGDKAILYGWHITDLVIYDKPRELTEFIIPSKIGCCNEGKCRGCKYFDRGNGFNIEDDCNAKFNTDEYKPLRRPPQSWCYVEERK